MKQLIRDFLQKYCALVKEDETMEYMELMMDNHHCISFEGKEWYVPDDNSLWNEDEEFIQEFLVFTYEL